MTVEIILFMIAVSILFPGSNGGSSFELMMIPVFIIGVALIVGFLAAIIHAAVFVAEMTESGWLGFATGLGLFFGAMFANKWFFERREWRTA